MSGCARCGDENINNRLDFGDIKFCSDICCKLSRLMCENCERKRRDRNIYIKSCDNYGRSNNNVYFCSQECKEISLTRRCHICYQDCNEMKEFNNHMYCNEELIDCYNLASGNYRCSFCRKDKNANDYYCTSINSFRVSEELCCEQCIGNIRTFPYIRNGCKWEGNEVYDKKWRATVACKYEEIIRSLHRLICNECGEMVIYHKLSVVDNRNICDSCKN